MNTTIQTSCAVLAVVLGCLGTGQDQPAQPEERFIKTREFFKALDSEKPGDRELAYEDIVREIARLHEELAKRIAQENRKSDERWDNKYISILVLGELTQGYSDVTNSLAENMLYRPVGGELWRHRNERLVAFPAARVLSGFGIHEGLERGMFPRLENAESIDEKELNVMAQIVEIIAGNKELARAIIESRKKSTSKEKIKLRYDRLLEQLK